MVLSKKERAPRVGLFGGFYAWPPDVYAAASHGYGWGFAWHPLRKNLQNLREICNRLGRPSCMPRQATALGGHSRGRPLRKNLQNLREIWRAGPPVLHAAASHGSRTFAETFQIVYLC